VVQEMGGLFAASKLKTYGYSIFSLSNILTVIIALSFRLMAIKKPRRLTSEELFQEAMAPDGRRFSEGEIRLLTSGQHFLQEHKAKHVNEIELNSIEGLIAYVAYTQEVSEKTVISVLNAQYDVEDPKNILARCYTDAMEFLVDLDIKKIVN